MAINQFLTYILPKKAIEQEFGCIPQQMEIKHAGLDFIEDVDGEINPEEGGIIKWWQEIPVEMNYLEQKIDIFISRADWGEMEDLCWKSEESEFDHDVSIDFNIREKYIEEFQFRTDLTDSTLTFLNSMLNLCEENNWILMDTNGNLCNPNLKDFYKLIKDSDPDRFLRNPIEFLKSLNKE